jgi:transcriptional regulator with XRE-family HTH domain
MTISFGSRIKELRRDQQLTQRELADRLQKMGLEADFTYLSKIENDNVLHPPSERLIRGMASVLGANAEELLDLAGKFDTKELQDLVTRVPEAGVLLRRLQSGALTREQIREILGKTEGQKDR